MNWEASTVPQARSVSGSSLKSAIAMGVGVGLMHYIGMAAMEMMADTHYDPMLFLLSVVVAVVVSLVALKLSLQFRHQNANKVLQILSAVVMGAGVVTLHYTGMAAASFKANPEKYIEATGFDNGSMAFIIASFTFVVLGATIVIAADKVGDKDFLRKS